MARNSRIDPIEKFRFRVTVVAIDLSLTGALDTLSALGGGDAGKFLRVISRAGFSQIQVPKVTVNSFGYRENLDAFRFQKGAGLARYDQVTLRRGVTPSRDFYDWYRLVNDEMFLNATAQELGLSAQKIVQQNDRYRKDVIIEVLPRHAGRTERLVRGDLEIGNVENDIVPVKSWYLFNAFPAGYKGGDDLDASSEEKLIEEITLEYEFFLELEGGLEGLVKELAKGAIGNLINLGSDALFPNKLDSSTIFE